MRLREEKRIDAMVKLAERTRKMREADETGKRCQIGWETFRLIFILPYWFRG